MFSNRFNNTKNDPLVEAVQNAMQDGEIRRQAVAYVNEAFGVYNRNAVVREQLADYDAAIEEAYKCMKEAPDTGESDARKTVKSGKEAQEKVFAKHKERVKKLADYSKMREKMVGKGTDRETTRKIVGEAKKLADKDYDKDGKVESPKDEVWGSRFRAAKMAGKMEEEQIDEVSKKTLGSYVGKSANANYGKEKLDREKGVKLAMKKISGKGVKVKATNEETDYSAPDRAAVTRDNKPSTPAQTNAATSGPSAADKAALTSKISTMKEAAYSAKAARAGKDIGKPGKEFKRIAKSAAARYGSEERGKKVAGAILKRIRAKHMKEEQIEEIVTKDALAKSGLSLRDYMNKERGLTRRDSSTSRPSVTSAPKASPVDAPSPRSTSGSSRLDTLKSITNPTPTVSKTQNMGSSISTGGSSAMDAVSALSTKQAATPGERTAPVNKMQNMGSSISTGGSSAMDKITSMGATQSSDTQKAKDVAKGVTSFAQSSSITGGIGRASEPATSKANKFSVDENKSLRESVQVGANKYRII